MKNELMHIDMVLNFTNVFCQLKTFTEFWLKSRRSPKSFCYLFLTTDHELHEDGAMSMSLTFVDSDLGHCLVHRRHSINVC